MPPYEGLALSQIEVLDDAAACADALAVMRAAGVVGFDTESKPVFERGVENTGPHVLQFATGERGWIVQASNAEGLEMARAVLEDAAIVKAGFGLNSDRPLLHTRFGISLHGAVDVGQSVKALGYKDQAGAKAAVAIVLQRRMAKSKRIQTSNWAAPTLTGPQLVYAANDAHAAFRVHAALAAGAEGIARAAASVTPPQGHNGSKPRRTPAAVPAQTAAARPTAAPARAGHELDKVPRTPRPRTARPAPSAPAPQPAPKAVRPAGGESTRGAKTQALASLLAPRPRRVSGTAEGPSEPTAPRGARRTRRPERDSDPD